MQARKILLAVDMNEPSGSSLAWATSLAQSTGATLLIACVEPGQPTSHYGSIYQGLADPGIADLAKRLAALSPGEAPVPCEHRILRGEPAPELLKLIADEKIDAVVLGAPVHTGLKHLFSGSTAETLLHKAHCPVMICRS
ncbi:MAG: universal stress protein [Pirellulales bacterium]